MTMSNQSLEPSTVGAVSSAIAGGGWFRRGLAFRR